MERKEIVKRISNHFGVKATYLSAPSFAYEINTTNEVYTIHRHGSITKANGESITLDEVLKQPLMEEPAENFEEAHIQEAHIHQEPITSLKELDTVEIKFYLKDHTATSLKNIINMLYSKQQLIMMAFETDKPFMDEGFAEDLNTQEFSELEELKAIITQLGTRRCPGFTINFEEGTFSFYLYGSELSDERISAFKDLGALITQYAKTLNRASFKQAQDDNPKYALRTWLIRIGMNGTMYKDSRKTLLKHLEGSGAFRKAGVLDET